MGRGTIAATLVISGCAPVEAAILPVDAPARPPTVVLAERTADRLQGIPLRLVVVEVDAEAGLGLVVDSLPLPVAETVGARRIGGLWSGEDGTIYVADLDTGVMGTPPTAIWRVDLDARTFAPEATWRPGARTLALRTGGRIPIPAEHDAFFEVVPDPSPSVVVGRVPPATDACDAHVGADVVVTDLEGSEMRMVHPEPGWGRAETARLVGLDAVRDASGALHVLTIAARDPCVETTEASRAQPYDTALDGSGEPIPVPDASRRYRLTPSGAIAGAVSRVEHGQLFYDGLFRDDQQGADITVPRPGRVAIAGRGLADPDGLLVRHSRTTRDRSEEHLLSRTSGGELTWTIHTLDDPVWGTLVLRDPVAVPVPAAE